MFKFLSQVITTPHRVAEAAIETGFDVMEADSASDFAKRVASNAAYVVDGDILEEDPQDYRKRKERK